MDEVEYLCRSALSGSTVLNRIGIMDAGTLIELVFSVAMFKANDPLD